MSDRYAAVDDELLLSLVGDCRDRCGFRDDALVRAASIGPHTLLRVTLPAEGKAVHVGDVIEHGIDIGNSELGLRSVQVTPVTYRLVCTNGMRTWRSEAALRLRHIGDPSRLHESLRDAISVAFAEARGQLELWRRSIGVLIDNALDEIESLRALGFSKNELEDVARHLLPAESSAESLSDALAGIEVTAFDVANAITASARDRSSISARLQGEEAGHRYLARRAG